MLSVQLNKNEQAVSLECTSNLQLPFKTFVQILELLEVKFNKLFTE